MKRKRLAKRVFNPEEKSKKNVKIFDYSEFSLRNLVDAIVERQIPEDQWNDVRISTDVDDYEVHVVHEREQTPEELRVEFEAYNKMVDANNRMVDIEEEAESLRKEELLRDKIKRQKFFEILTPEQRKIWDEL